MRGLATLLVTLVAAGAPRAAAAQRVSKDGCRVDSSAAWFRAQRAWSDESRHDWADESFRAALLRATGGDAPRDALLGFELADAPPAGRGDSATVARLRALAAQRGAPWPTRSVVGPAGVRAVWLLAARDTALARTALHRMMEAGPDESPPAAVAILEDRLRLLAGRKQIYGTQLVRGAGGALAPAPTEDPAHLDLRREAAGLAPLAQALCAASSARAR